MNKQKNIGLAQGLIAVAIIGGLSAPLALLALVSGAVVIGEVISLTDAVSAAIVLIGVLVCTRAANRKKLSVKLASIETLK